MRLPRFAALLLTSAAACSAPPAHERAVIEYVEAIRANDCEKAFALLSTTVQAAIRAEDEAQSEEKRGGIISRVPPRELYCSAGPYDRVKLHRTRTAWRNTSEAEVHLIEAVPAGHLVPGFWPTRTEYQPMALRVVLESTAWKVQDARLLEELNRRSRARQEALESRRKAQEWNRRLGVNVGPREGRKP